MSIHLFYGVIFVALVFLVILGIRDLIRVIIGDDL
jgi:hypothetical protein